MDISLNLVLLYKISQQTKVISPSYVKIKLNKNNIHESTTT